MPFSSKVLRIPSAQILLSVLCFAITCQASNNQEKLRDAILKIAEVAPGNCYSGPSPSPSNARSGPRTPKPDEGCKVSVQHLKGDLKEPQPLIVHEGEYGPAFLYPPDRTCDLQLKTNDNILISCPGWGNMIEGVAGATNTSEIKATCVGGKTFSTNSIPFDFGSVSCKFASTHESRRTATPCYGNGKKVRIGFGLKRSFLPTMDICWNDETMMSLWSMFNLTTKIGCCQSSYPRPFFQAEDFYKNYDIDYLYRTRTELKTVTRLLGDRRLAQHYIQTRSTNLMSRGHMTARTDFVYGNAQSTTFMYVNAAPQWHAFNSGNWNTLEINIRQFAVTRDNDIQVYTGVHGQMSLTGKDNVKVPIYLYVNGSQKAFPVPKFYWKVIYDPVTTTGTAFVGLNDPWVDEIPENICNDISAQITWLTWSPQDIIKGVSYACTVDDLRTAIPSVPSLEVTGILA